MLLYVCVCVCCGLLTVWHGIGGILVKKLKLYIYIAPSSGNVLPRILYVQLITPTSGTINCVIPATSSHLNSLGSIKGHKAASRCSEPIWNAQYLSTHHQCWYSFYLLTEGWRVESTPGQVESGVGIKPGTSHVKVHCSTNGAISAHTALHICIDSMFISADII